LDEEKGEGEEEEEEEEEEASFYYCECTQIVKALLLQKPRYCCGNKKLMDQHIVSMFM
jgi:hypothetical protein